MRVLRPCSVFEPPPSAGAGKGAKFDPIGGMQNHTAVRRGVRPIVYRSLRRKLGLLFRSKKVLSRGAKVLVERKPATLRSY
jgi:hypothetical protein